MLIQTVECFFFSPQFVRETEASENNGLTISKQEEIPCAQKGIPESSLKREEGWRWEGLWGWVSAATALWPQNTTTNISDLKKNPSKEIISIRPGTMQQPEHSNDTTWNISRSQLHFLNRGKDNTGETLLAFPSPALSFSHSLLSL